MDPEYDAYWAKVQLIDEGLRRLRKQRSPGRSGRLLVREGLATRTGTGIGIIYTLTREGMKRALALPRDDD